MMRREHFLLGILLLIFTTPVIAQKGKVFPKLEMITVDRQMMTLPLKKSVKPSLIVMACSPKAEKVMSTWAQPFYDNFLSASPKGQLFEMKVYEVEVFFAGMLGGVKNSLEGQVLKRMKTNVDPKLHSHAGIYKGDVRSLRKKLSIEKSSPKLFVLNTNGKIVHMVSGEYTPQKMRSIEAALDRL
ncbi:hypothetical protein [Algivirga pacifica]|uniref:Thioredoxin domain-containing protein n=1 Tax=Algivirga pacifica TaxID=1162670 RepID=A0ABP9DBX2_9BACT